MCACSVCACVCIQHHNSSIVIHSGCLCSTFPAVPYTISKEGDGSKKDIMMCLYSSCT